MNRHAGLNRNISGRKERLLYRLLLGIKPFISKNMLVFGIIAVALLLYTMYTMNIVKKLENDALNVSQTYTELIRTAISESMSNDQMNVVFDSIIRKTNIPIIITDSSWNPITWKNIRCSGFFFHKEMPSQDTSRDAIDYINKKITDFTELYDAKPLYLKGTSVKIGYLVFGKSELVYQLSMIPVYEICLVFLFFITVYISFKSVRVTERSNLWVGLAKETAHQLGTPISSLMGWVEYVKTISSQEPPPEPEEYVKEVHKICDNMDNDIMRLKKITNRFSRIGSIPELAPCDINSVIQDSMQYFESRLPMIGRRIELKSDLGKIPKTGVNRELIEWVFENLFKNSIDAITKIDGLIEIKTEFIKCDNIVRIYHRDNGRGISWEDHKKIFAPGYSTKKRGWGLGLTLAKRIIEDYHGGRIYLNWSQKDKGTVFCIDLPAIPA
jgi:hypothetical protein